MSWPMTIMMTMIMTMMMMMVMVVMVVMVVVGEGGGLSREKSRDVLEQLPEYLLKQEDSS
jgi:preprotein translocase subunit SecG